MKKKEFLGAKQILLAVGGFGEYFLGGSIMGIKIWSCVFVLFCFVLFYFILFCFGGDLLIRKWCKRKQLAGKEVGVG